MSNKHTFDVTLHVVTDTETGEQWIARPDSYFDEEKLLAEYDLEDRCAMSRVQGTPEKKVKQERAQALALLADIIEKQRAKHAAAREGADVLTFTLQALTGGDDRDARAAARDAMGATDPDNLGFERLCRGLVVEGDGGPRAITSFIRQQSPLVMRELIARINATAEADPRRIVVCGKG